MDTDVKTYEDVVYESLVPNTQRYTLRRRLIDAGVPDSEIEASEKRARDRADTEASALLVMRSWWK